MKLPTILAGPIIKRASVDDILIWISSSKPLVLRGELYASDIDSIETANRKIIGAGKTVKEVRMGENLFIQILSIQPNKVVQKKFVGNRLLFYDIFVNDDEQKRNKPTSSIFYNLIVRSRICYPGYKLPSLVICRDDRNTLRSLFGSCRKIHGAGTDGIHAADREIRQYLNLPHRRINSLMFIGDQIYSDDIPNDVFSYVLKLSKKIGGEWYEEPNLYLPSIRKSSRAINFTKTGARGSLVQYGNNKNYTGFTIDSDSEIGVNHLISEYEFAAATLIGWNSSFWEGKHGLLNTINSINKSGNTKKDLLQKKRSRDILNYYDSTVLLTRILANTSTYMIFDDHDVTDDWNLNIDWVENLKPLGHKIVRNSLYVYSIFQNWGNAARPQDDKAVKLIEHQFSMRKQIGRKKSSQFAHSYNLSTLKDITSNHLSFSTPTNPPVTFIDSRTKRERALVTDIESLQKSKDSKPDIIKVESNTKLISSDEKVWLTNTLKDHQGSPLVLVTTSPVFSHFHVDQLKNKLGAGKELIDKAKSAFNIPTQELASYMDIEHWQANPESLFSIFDIIHSQTSDKAIILSGDVHYSFSCKVKLTVKGKVFEVLQLNSSALKNELEKEIQDAIEVSDYRTTITKAWWWKEGESNAKLFNDHLSNPSRYAELLKELGEPTYLTEVHLLPYYSAGLAHGIPFLGKLEESKQLGTETLRSKTVEFQNSIGSLSVFGGDILAEHLVMRGAKRRKSWPILF